MNFREYIPLAKRTITYDSHQKLLFCSMAGLIGELTEYFEHSKSTVKPKMRKAELGDVCWYFAILADYLQLEIDTSSVSQYYLLSSCGYQTIGKIQEILKKVARDKNWIPDAVDRDRLSILFSDLMYGVERECAIYSWNFSDILQQNVEKLADRMDRGVLQGSGDER